MSAPVKITRADCTSAELHRLADCCKCPRQARRLRCVAMVAAGGTGRGEAAAAHGTTRQSVRDWILRYNRDGPDGLCDLARDGRPRRLTADQEAEVGRWLDEGPDPVEDGLARWRLSDIRDRVLSRFRVSLCLESVRRLVRSLGFRCQSPRPIHPKADLARQEAFRRGFRETVEAALPGPVTFGQCEIWFQDEARAGQKGMLARIWSRRGIRPRVPRDHRYGYACLFAAACGARERAVGHVCDRANTSEMNRHLADISAAVAPGRHGVLVLDGAGWHRSRDLVVPDNLTLVRLPPYSPELNPMENAFAHLKSNHLANRVFPTAEDVRHAIGAAWDRFVGDPSRIRSITTRSWASREPESRPT